MSHVAELGGAERSLLDLLDCLDRDQFSARVALPHGGELSERLSKLGIPFDYCPALRRLKRSRRPALMLIQAAALLSGSLQLRGLIARTAPHLVHANSAASALFAALAARTIANSPPLIWHMRDFITSDRISRHIACRASAIIAPSRACRANALAVARVGTHSGGSESVQGCRIERIPNGIRLPSTSVGADSECSEAVSRTQLRRSLGVELDAPLALVVGQFVPWKGHRLALEAIRIARRRVCNLRVLIVGDDRFGDHPGLAGELARCIEEAGLEDAVELLGHREDVPELFACADFLIHPAYPEPFGRVVVEAMAAALPVVAFAGDHGPAEMVRDGVDGLLVTPRTETALARAIEQVAGRIDTAAMGASGQRRALELYDRTQMARSVEKLYSEVCQTDKSARSQSIGVTT